MKVLITGDSHTAALKLGADMLISNGELNLEYQIYMRQLGSGATFDKPFFVDRGEFAEITNELHKKRIKRLPLSKEQEDFEYYGISAPLLTIRLWGDKQYWTKFTPFSSQGDQAPISASLLRYIVLQDQIHMTQLIELLKRVGVKVFVIEAPKPFKHHPAIKIAGNKVITYVDQFYRQVMKDWLAEKGVPIINVPSACYDADGFMLETYRNDNRLDRTHANKQFGAVMVKEIISFLKSCD